MPEVSKANSDIILAYLNDMERGINLGKGCPKTRRKPSRLNDLKGKMVFFANHFEQKYNIPILTSVTKRDIHQLIMDMDEGVIEKQNGGKYQDTKTFARDFKAFWNWWIKVNAEKDIFIKVITDDLNTRPLEESHFVFLKKSELKRLLDKVNFNYRTQILAELDFCIRPPTETVNVKVSDFSEDCKEIHIRDCTVKKGSFGRTNKLTFSSEILKQYIEQEKLKPDDYLFNTCPASANKYLQKYAKELFGTGMTRGGKPYHKLTMYHFRHMACCYWSKILNKDIEIMKRFGWKQSNKIYYYSKFLEDDDEYDLVTFLKGNMYELHEKKKAEEITMLRGEVAELKMQMSTIVDFVKSISNKKDKLEELQNNSNKNNKKLSIAVSTD